MRQVRFSPEQGWISVTLLLLMALLLGWTIDDSRWILGRDGLTDFLPWAALGGAVVGVTGGVLGMGRWRTYLIGSVLAALIVPTLIGSIIINGPASLIEMYQAVRRPLHGVGHVLRAAVAQVLDDGGE